MFGKTHLQQTPVGNTQLNLTSEAHHIGGQLIDAIELLKSTVFEVD